MFLTLANTSTFGNVYGDYFGDKQLASTLLVPTDEAFAKYLAGMGMADSRQWMMQPSLQLIFDVLRYHLIPQVAAFSSNLTDGQVLPTSLSVDGVTKTISVRLENSSVYFDGENSTAKVITADIQSGKSVIHIIDTVLVPDVADGGQRRPMYPSVAAAADANNLTLLLQAATAAGLAPTLSSESLVATVFAPTNEALAAAFTSLGLPTNVSLLSAPQLAALRNVLLYHVTSTALLSSQLADGAVLQTAYSVQGQGTQLTVAAGNGSIEIVADNSTASVIAANITAGKAVVHVIDTVLLPASFAPVPPRFTSVAEAAVQSNLTLLAQAVTAAGLLPLLSDPELVSTVFAPTDEAFRTALPVLGITNLSSLSEAQRLSLRSVLVYHVVLEEALFAAALRDGDLLTTALRGQDRAKKLTVNIENGTVSIEADKSTAQVVVPNVTAGKSVVHVVNAVLVPQLRDDDNSAGSLGRGAGLLMTLGAAAALALF